MVKTRELDDESFFGESYFSEEEESDEDSIGKNSQLNSKSSVEDDSRYMINESNARDPNLRTGQNNFKIDKI